MPSYGEIMELVGFRSRHAVTRLVDCLVAEGLVTKDPQGKLIPHARNGEVPLLGIVDKLRQHILYPSANLSRPCGCRTTLRSMHQLKEPQLLRREGPSRGTPQCVGTIHHQRFLRIQRDECALG